MQSLLSYTKTTESGTEDKYYRKSGFTKHCLIRFRFPVEKMNSTVTSSGTNLMNIKEKTTNPTTSGNGGNEFLIFQDLPIVIIITSKAYNKPYGHPQSERIVKDFILPAILK